MTEILVLYYSRTGAVEALAREVCRGIDAVNDVEARLRTVPPVSAITEATADTIPSAGPPYVTHADLNECDGLVMGSPTRFGNMAAPLKYFLDSTGSEWLGGTLSGKPAGVFTSTSTLHGGQESTLLTMALPLIHHGMLLVGIPYTEPELSTTTTGGSPYGASHVSWNRDTDGLSAEEKKLAQALGKRVAQIAVKLRAVR
ncbi:MAG: NAD(P)H:quinone oxidoreductase [Proteobacteria bacterium]|nr:NAD(P)H:quinone oxidoreductase [Pseudomonadota bacterium]MDA0992907.1 NAD(P)H:quinone oxidoreductase [Pseudomonadota bacterium]